jgi:two-component system cell cycle response regulator DivK
MSISSDPAHVFVGRPVGLAPLILLVDDSSEDLAFYAEKLIAAGFRVETATTGGEGVARALSSVPDLVVMDLEMPGIDGWEATKLLRSRERTGRVPIIAFSGFHGTAVVMRAIRAGCNTFLPKPCFASELRNVIQTTLERAREKKESVRPPAESQGEGS